LRLERSQSSIVQAYFLAFFGFFFAILQSIFLEHRMLQEILLLGFQIKELRIRIQSKISWRKIFDRRKDLHDFVRLMSSRIFSFKTRLAMFELFGWQQMTKGDPWYRNCSGKRGTVTL